VNYNLPPGKNSPLGGYTYPSEFSGGGGTVP